MEDKLSMERIEMPPDPALERESLLTDQEAVMLPLPIALSIKRWLKDRGFDLDRPIQRRREEMYRGDLFLQYSDNRSSIHNI